MSAINENLCSLYEKNFWARRVRYKKKQKPPSRAPAPAALVRTPARPPCGLLKPDHSRVQRARPLLTTNAYRAWDRHGLVKYPYTREVEKEICALRGRRGLKAVPVPRPTMVHTRISRRRAGGTLGQTPRLLRQRRQARRAWVGTAAPPTGRGRPQGTRGRSTARGAGSPPPATGPRCA